MSEPGRSENLSQSPEAISRANLAKSMDNFSGRMFKGGANILRLGVGTGVAAAEVLVPTSLWLPKIGAIAGGYLLDRLGRTNPNSKAAILAQKIGEGAWKGGAFGLASSLVLNTVIEPQARYFGVAIPSSPDVIASAVPTGDRIVDTAVQMARGGGQSALDLIKSGANEHVLFTDRLGETMDLIAKNESLILGAKLFNDVRFNPADGIQRLQTQVSGILP